MDPNLGVIAGERAHAEHRLCLAVPLVDGQAGCVFPGLDHFGIEWFSRTNAVRYR